MSEELVVAAHPIRDLGLESAKDLAIFERARLAGAIILTKDADFVNIVRQRGPPPSILWVTIGNTSTERVQALLTEHWSRVRLSLARGEALIELRGRE
jgi:predicted nuclease of predicted toxin-antitoxin system